MRRILRLVGWSALGLLVLLLSVTGALTLLRWDRTARVVGFGEAAGAPAAASPEFARTAALLTVTSLLPGNRLEVLSNGRETFPPLWRDLRAARRSITTQLYFINPGAVLDSLVLLLRERAAAGVEVRFLYDAVGSRVPDSTLTGLRAAGVRVARFRPVRWYTLQKAQNRSHARTVVIDGALGFTGGFGIDDRWLGDGRSPHEWRETNVRFTGPAVAQLQAAFAAAWAEATGQLLAGRLHFPPDPSAGIGPPPPDPIEPALAGVLHSVAGPGNTGAQRLFALTAAGARQRLFLTNAYFVPDRDIVEMLSAAARRDVDVRLLLPGPLTDVPLTRAAARAHYEPLLRAGVRIWEYTPAMMHAKTFVVDRCWIGIGTMNLDPRSFVHNDEVVLLAWDREAGAMLDSMFLDDLHFAREITLPTFARRPWRQRLGEAFAIRFKRFL